MLRPEKARWATALFFALDGLGFGVWAAHIPVFKENLHLSSIALSEVLLALVVGSLLTMPVAGHIIARIGSRRVIWTACAVYTIALAALGWVGSLPPLLAVAALFGASMGAFDVSVNAQGVWVQQELGKPVVSSFQGFWSAGGLLGAMLSSYALRHGGSLREDFSRTAVALLCLALLGCSFLLKEEIHAVHSKRPWQMPDRGLLLLAGIAFLGLFAEGAMADWGGVFMKSSVGVSLAQAAIGYAAFSVSMAIGRFAGDWLSTRFAPVTILRSCGLLLFCGLTFALTLNVWWAAITGFICAGFGVANIVPVIWGAAGRNKVLGTGPAIATVATVGYFGFLAGPPLIGLIATVSNIRLALVTVAVFGVAIAGSSRLAAGRTD